MLPYYILLPLVSYLISSIPFGLLIAKLFYKVDVRTLGSGNIGATNVTRTCGKLPGILTFILDFYKGVVVVIFTRIYFSSNIIEVPHLLELLICIFAIIGHSYSCYLKFKGGKGVAISFACLAILYPPVALNLFMFWLLMILQFRTVGLASVSTSFLLFLSAIGTLLTYQAFYDFLFMLITAGVIIIKHLPNIRDIRSKLEKPHATNS